MLNNTLYRDFLFLTLMAFVLMVLLIIPWLNPPTQEQDGDIVPPGNVNVHIQWTQGNHDVDLWVLGPKEYLPIGYSNKGGFVWNLVRDDLGGPDPELNYENSYSRGLFAGEYIINVHCYRCEYFPIAVKVEVSVKKPKGISKKTFNILAKTTLDLNAKREEVTALRFKLTKEGDLVPESLNHIYMPLRSMDGR